MGTENRNSNLDKNKCVNSCKNKRKDSCNFLLHKVGKYCYISRQIPVKIDNIEENLCNAEVVEYRHEHVGPVIENCSPKNKCVEYIFKPSMNVFLLSKNELRKLKIFIDKKYPKNKWSIDYNLIENGIELNKRFKYAEDGKKVTSKEFVYKK